MTQAEIKAKIEKLEKGLKNPVLPDQFKDKARQQIKELKAKLTTPKKTPRKKPTAKKTATTPKTPTRKKPTAKKTATTPKTPAKKGKSTKRRGKMTDTQRYISDISKRATQIQRAGGKQESANCKMVYKINRADAVKKAAKEIQFDAGNKNRPDFMDGLLGTVFGKKSSKKK